MPQRDDTRLIRVVIDLLGPTPAEGDLWVRSQTESSGKQIEVASAEMQAFGARRILDHPTVDLAKGQTMTQL